MHQIQRRSRARMPGPVPKIADAFDPNYMSVTMKFFALAAIVAAAALAGCGKQETPAPAPTPATAPAAPAPAATTAPAAPASATTTAAADADNAVGKSLYGKTCALCHAAGVAGAPKPGDKEDWAPRIAQGMDTLNKHAIEGFTGKKGQMPARGGSSATDDEMKAAVKYMVDQSR
jgi:cytochrome c5